MKATVQITEIWTEARVKEVAKILDNYYDVSVVETRKNGEVLEFRVSSAAEWTFAEMEAISEAFGTKAIDLEDGGCGTCGWGSTIRVWLPCD